MSYYFAYQISKIKQINDIKIGKFKSQKEGNIFGEKYGITVLSIKIQVLMLLDPEINYINNDKCKEYLLQYYLKY